MSSSNVVIAIACTALASSVQLLFGNSGPIPPCPTCPTCPSFPGAAQTPATPPTVPVQTRGFVWSWYLLLVVVTGQAGVLARIFRVTRRAIRVFSDDYGSTDEGWGSAEAESSSPPGRGRSGRTHRALDDDERVPFVRPGSPLGVVSLRRPTRHVAPAPSPWSGGVLGDESE